ncbi:hypothetical protein ASD04_04345 [Devosia sp. Root436]|jgi:cytochrome c|uniref:c-type cytochrome n=1 Tax=Devosia sp. Root436 TaxID=1736537 RepID=UPI0006FE217B|nr:c-type cytochrome [Devosia sp. Root436]KQX39888.1 hypothetical protein ASD04_04345 [Devosia sp. Root436]
MRFLLVSALCLAIMPVAAQDMPPDFKKCLPCHAIGEGAINKVGPQLNGVVGQPAGRVAGYAYSQAMLAAQADGLEWNRQTLTQYLKRPKHLIVGTSMTFAGMTDRAAIDAVIDYLASFDSEGERVTP